MAERADAGVDDADQQALRGLVARLVELLEPEAVLALRGDTHFTR